MIANLSSEKMELLIKLFKRVETLRKQAISKRNEKNILEAISAGITMHMTCAKILSDSDKLLLNQRLA